MEATPTVTPLADLLSIDPGDVDHFDAKDRAWYEAELDKATNLRSPAAFATAHSHGLWLPYKHLVHTSNRIVAMIEGDECDCLIIEEPVRHGKSELCSRWTPAWFIVKYQRPVLLASYEADFAAGHGRVARGIVTDVGETYGVRLDETSRSASRWQLNGSRGGMTTSGVGGPLTGRGGALMIVDDPIKNSEEANSEVMREHLWEWWQAVFLTRREPGGKVLVIMSRWHADDLVGRLTKADTGMRIERIRLPAIAEDGDPLGRMPGQALCPERYDEKALELTRVDVGPYSWAALYQQSPVAAGGGMFRREMFRYFTSRTIDGETYFQIGEHLVADADCWRFATMDPAYTKGQRSDYTVLATWVVAPTDPATLLLRDVRRVRVEHADHAPMIRDAWITQSPSWIGVEKQAATLSLFAEVQREGVVVRWLTPDKNKVARAETAVALVDAGRIYFPKDAPWLADFETELTTFPVGAHDDQVDVLSYAANELARRTVRAHRRREEPQTAADRMWQRIQERERTKHLHPTLGRF